MIRAIRRALYYWLVYKPWVRHTEEGHCADYDVCTDLYCRFAQPFDRWYFAHVTKIINSFFTEDDYGED